MIETIISIILVLFWIFLMFGFMAIGIGMMIIWIIMLIDVIKRDFEKENDKIVWLLVVILAGGIGAIIYYFIIKRPDKH